VTAREGQPWREGPRLARAGLLALPVAWAALLLLLPGALLFTMSTGSRPTAGGVAYDGSMEAWRWLADRAPTAVLPAAMRSVRLAGIATLIAMLVATPVAWWIANAPLKRRPLLLLLVVLPSWTSFLLRTYAWRVMFGTEGPINALLEHLSLGAVRFLNTEAAVVVGLVYGYLPFAVLPLYVAVERLDRDLLAAARDLGAGPIRTFFSVAFPLTLPGTVAGAILVFVPSLAAFVTPAVLGGADTYMIGQLTQEQFMKWRNWPVGAVLGSALATAALVVLLLPLLARRRARHA
jgi:spermidine/putrescine transport system permease protein